MPVAAVVACLVLVALVVAVLPVTQGQPKAVRLIPEVAAVPLTQAQQAQAVQA